MFLQKTFLTFVILLTFCSIFPESQAGKYNFKNYSVQDGLVQMQVTAMMQDSRGYLWFGTVGGVSRFDGLNFKSFTMANGLSSNFIKTILEDSEGNIWFGTQGGGATKYTGDKFIVYSINEGMIDINVWSIIEDQKKNIWFGNSTGVSVLMNHNDSILTYSALQGIFPKKVLTMLIDRTGDLWLGTQGAGIMKMAFKKGIYTGSPSYLNTLTGLADNNIYDLTEDGAGNIWAATDRGVDVIGMDGIKHIDTKRGLSENRTRCILKDIQGNMWIATWSSGVCKLQFNPSKPYSVDDFTVQPFTRKNGLAHDYVYSIIEDNEGNMWIGTFNGLSIFRKQGFLHFTEDDGLKHPLVFAIHKDKMNNFWLGTLGGDVYKFYPEEEKFERFLIKNGIQNNIVRDIFEDNSGNLWFATEFQGVSRFDGKKFMTFTTADGLSDNFVRDIIQEPNGCFWFATQNGISRYDQNAKKGKEFTLFNTSNGLSHNDVYQIIMDKIGSIWTGTNGGGITILSKEQNDTAYTFSYYSEKDGLSSNFITTFLQDRNDNLWIGTVNGVDRLRNGKFVNFSEKDGLSSNTIFSLVFDDKSNLWIGTNRGLDKMDVGLFNKTEGKFDLLKGGMTPKGEVSIKHYGNLEGFNGIECGWNSAYKDNNGMLWFGNQFGITRYNPSEDIFNTIPPRIHITNIRLFFRDVNWANDSGMHFTSFDKWHNLPLGLELPYDKNHLTFEYVGLSFSIPEKVGYMHKLDNWDKSLSPLAADRSVTYSNLAPGPYVFRVDACNNDGVCSQDPVVFRFVITPPFWQTWWFYLFGLLALFFIFYIIIALRVRRYRKTALVLKETVELQTRELREEKEKVEVQKTELEKINKKLWNTGLGITREKEKVDEQNRIIEKKNKDITSSIRYARRIQKAIFPVKEEIKTLFPESFIFFQPKELLSGDFYWFTRLNGKAVVAAVDCTGHGVPGAIMSMIGNDLLRQAVVESKITDPALALTQMHGGLITALKKDLQEGDADDGMDITLCYLDLHQSMLEFSAAGRSLVFIRNSELQLIRGNIFPLGLIMDGERTYNSNKIKLQKGDMIYLFSDGYCDQFGGDSGEKLMSERFHKILLEIHKLPVDDQEKTLETNFNAWRKNHPQVDDILIIGIRI